MKCSTWLHAAAFVLAFLKSAPADIWSVPMIDSPGGTFDHIQVLMAPGYHLDAPALLAFGGLDGSGDPSAAAESWAQTFLNDDRTFAAADGPSDGYAFLAFAIAVDGNRLIDRPLFHYQTYLSGVLVGNWDVKCVGAGELDWTISAGTWGANRAFPPWLPGDSDMDTDVDIHDYSDWQQNYTGPGATGKLWEEGDWDGDGDVDIHDFSLWQQNYTGPGGPALGQSTAIMGFGYGAVAALPPASSMAVPEPASLSILSAGAVAVLTGMRRKRGRA
ncbi:MAG: hypothetical protein BIFFINMI_00866 [Phycisphaerae bacterium]|nr:hypothetical protein [Phycisphaerae bacterium]